MMITNRRLWSNTSARIPFSLFGIFLLLGSTFTTVLLFDQGIQQRDTQITSLSYQDIDHSIGQLEIDLSILLNHLSVNALYEIGLNPVVAPNDASKSADEINQQRLKQKVLQDLQHHLKCSYQDNLYQTDRYIINVDFTQPLQLGLEPTIHSLSLKIHRPLNPPLISPPSTKMFDTYYTLSIPLFFEIRDSITSEEVTTMIKIISSSITSRYPLLYHLVNEYNESINGLGPLWGLTTMISNIYSLARGYKHYQTGKPANVVDNKHLAPILNAGLLLQNVFVFGGVDPLSLIKLGSSVKKAIHDKQETSPMDSFNNLTDSSYDLSLDEFSTICANIDAEDPIDTEIITDPSVNLSSIALQPLYLMDTVHLCFQKDSQSITVEQDLTLDETQIQDLILEYIEQGYTFCGITPATTQSNMTTVDQIQHIISNVYSSMMFIQVQRDEDPLILLGDHHGFPIDNGSEAWTIADITHVNELKKPSKGYINIGSILFGDVYDITWTRIHHWSNRTIESSNNQTIVKWSEYTTNDTKEEKGVRIASVLDSYSNYQGLSNDIKDIFYFNLSVDDPNLIDTINTYKETYYDTYLSELLRKDSGTFYKTTINGSIPVWVEQDAWESLQDIYDQICLIATDPVINSTTYPDPSILLEKTFEDLTKKYQENISTYLHTDMYLNENLFGCCGFKAVYCVRFWYVTYLNELIDSVFASIIHQMDETFTQAFVEYDIQQDTFHQTLNSDTNDVLNGFLTIPFGIELFLTSDPLIGGIPWEESITIAVNQYPDYLCPFEEVEYEGKKEYFLGVQNICLLGPTGIPLLPVTPATPWIVILNLWVISVKGSYAYFEISDCKGETIFHPF
ncbi:MAG: hypothetical protein QCH96_07225, partial [Candidatus Thermoplasmatota archaeon]|nr:hypothetical protein [Candidatus Thermoplasmatota archaeon]